MASALKLYDDHFVKHGFERLALFETLRDEFGVQSAMYLGSFVHITPAFVFPRTAFVDSDRRVQKFFDSPEVAALVESKKQYSGAPDIVALQQNYERDIPAREPYDLLISQYAGFVSQAGKPYLKDDGLLLANNSHGDASMAFLDDDYDFIGAVTHSRGRWRVSTVNLDSYFTPKKGEHPPREDIQASMKGVGYTKSAANYLFRVAS